MADRIGIVKALLKGAAPGGPHPGGIHVYHSSPHDFDKFDWSKLRTGEGANTYGAGFYFAENPAVSGQGGQYWKQFRHRFGGPEAEASDFLLKNEFDREQAVEAARKWAKDARGHHEVYPTPVSERAAQHYEDVLRRLEARQPVGPRTYEVNIAARPELMLDWDKPLAQQPQVAEKLPALFEGAGREAYDRALAATSKSRADELWGMTKDVSQAPGEFAYQDLVRQMATKYGHRDKSLNANYASQTMAEAGIPGIRYLDQGSRPMPAPELANLQWRLKQAEEAQQKYPQMQWSHDDVARYQKQIAEEQARAANPSYNYVVTDPSKLDILGKYGVVGTAGGGLGVLAAQDQYGEAR